MDTGAPPLGQEIESHQFSREDFERFHGRLEEETRLLESWFRDGRFVDEPPVGGLEVEAWLVDRDHRPAAVNDAFLERMASPLVVPELSRFNVEINSSPVRLAGTALRAMEDELGRTYARCEEVAATLGAHVVWVGILPSLVDTELSLANMSRLKRYRALNEQVLRLRGGRPIALGIEGHESLHTEHHDVMLESAATSLQIHMQVSQGVAHRYYNAAKIAAAPMVAVCANSPFLFGRDLWAETRVPLFEQSVAVAGRERVTFGDGFAAGSLAACFRRNLEEYDVLLPMLLDEAQASLPHLRLHNGTIWRWNRPLIGFDEAGQPHLRIEHRVAAAPTSVIDGVANVALFFGLAHHLATLEPPPESRIDFAEVRDSFYRAARLGLDATIPWPGRAPGTVREVLQGLLPAVADGLAALGIAGEDVTRFLGVIADRLERGQNGSVWQRAYAAARGRDMRALTRAYRERQGSGLPVHLWDV